MKNEIISENEFIFLRFFNLLGQFSYWLQHTGVTRWTFCSSLEVTDLTANMKISQHTRPGAPLVSTIRNICNWRRKATTWVWVPSLAYFSHWEIVSKHNKCHGVSRIIVRCYWLLWSINSLFFFSVRTCSILKVNYSSDHGTSAGKDPVPEGACGTKKAPLKRAVTPIGNSRFLSISF